jgi:hypothetical protein
VRVSILAKSMPPPPMLTTGLTLAVMGTLTSTSVDTAPVAKLTLGLTVTLAVLTYAFIDAVTAASTAAKGPLIRALPIVYGGRQADGGEELRLCTQTREDES